MKKQKRTTTTTTNGDVWDKAVGLAEELGIRVYAQRHQLSLPVARACVAAIGMGESKQDEAAWAAILDDGERQLSIELGMLPAAFQAWLRLEGYVERHDYPQRVHLDRIERALHATA